MAAETIIQLVGLHKTFQTKSNTIEALKGIDLEIAQGEVFGIIGMSGAGKSTLVRCINLLERPTAGQVVFDGVDLMQVNSSALRKARQSMGMIFQQFNLLMQRSAMANVCFPLEIAGVPAKEAKARAKELLELVGLEDRENAYPAQLSGGQKQRVAIARALATNPKVLLCDEATSALDPTTTRSILRLLKDINKRLGITVIIITHEMSVIEEVCQRVAIIDGGVIAECGKVEDVFTKPKTQAARKLVYPDGERSWNFQGTRFCRIVFDGNSSFEPVIANMVLDCKQPVNIMYANTKNIDGKAFGQMVIQLPEDDKSADRLLAYLRERNVSVEEVENYAGR